MRYWPIAEAFIASEIFRAGLTFQSLDTFGDTSAFDWYPPTLEDDLPDLAGCAFLHPVLDPARYVAVNLRSNRRCSAISGRAARCATACRGCPPSAYVHLLPAAMLNRARSTLRTRLGQIRLRPSPQLPAG